MLVRRMAVSMNGGRGLVRQKIAQEKRSLYKALRPIRGSAPGHQISSCKSVRFGNDQNRLPVVRGPRIAEAIPDDVWKAMDVAQFNTPVKRASLYGERAVCNRPLLSP